MAKNIIDWRYWWMKLDPVEDVRVNGGICHNFCGPATIDNFKRELGDNAKIKGGKTICNIVIEVPAYEFPFIYLEDKDLVEYEPLYSGKDDRLIQDYRFDVSKLEPSVAKVSAVASIANGNFPAKMGHKKSQLYSPYIAAASAFTQL